MSSISDNTKALRGRQVLGMLLLSMGLYAIVLGLTVPLALLSWPGAGSNDASLGQLVLLARTLAADHRDDFTLADCSFCTGKAFSRCRTLLVTGVSATIVYAVAYVCSQVAAAGSGPINGQPLPGSPVYPLVSFLVGSVDILIIVYWLTRKGIEPGLSD